MLASLTPSRRQGPNGYCIGTQYVTSAPAARPLATGPLRVVTAPQIRYVNGLQGHARSAAPRAIIYKEAKGLRGEAAKTGVQPGELLKPGAGARQQGDEPGAPAASIELGPAPRSRHRDGARAVERLGEAALRVLEVDVAVDLRLV